MNIVNKKVKFDYEIIKTYEAGIILKGAEVKSIREGRMSIKEGFCKIIKNEIFLLNSTIQKYEQSNTFQEIDERRPKKLLLKKKEILKLLKEVNKEGLSIIPTKVYFNENNKCKIEIILGKGKKLYDKRNSIKEKDIKRKLNSQKEF